MRSTKPEIKILPPVFEDKKIKTLEAKLSGFQIINFKGRAIKQAQRKLMTSDMSKQVLALADKFYDQLLLAAFPRHGGLNA